MIIKGLIDQNYKVLDRVKLPSPHKANFTFHNENGDNTEKNLDEDLLFVNTQETPLAKSLGSFNNSKNETPVNLK